MPYQEDNCEVNSVSMNNSGNMNNNNSDSGNIQNPAPPSTAGMTKAEIRKSNKPIMEKKRRARINHCLNELKTLILEAMRKDPARHTKLEKADILEMTVKHLQSIQRQQLVMAVSSDPTVIHKFKSGFVDCAEEVNRYISQMEGLEVPVKQRLMNHLNSCVNGLQQISPFNFGTGFTGNVVSSLGQHHMAQGIPLQQDINNNTNGGQRIQMGGNQFIPTRLPTGELALVVPNSNNLPFFPSAATNFSATPTVDINASYPRLSAFNAVTKNLSRPIGTSPPLSPISSISSLGDDSSQPSEYNILPNATTPPLQMQSNHQSLFSAFPTPPSGNNSFKNTLQQPHITSTTETLKSMATTNLNPTVINHQSNLVAVVTGTKRAYPTDVTDTIRDEKIRKICCSPIDHENNNNNNNNNNNDVLLENNNLNHHNRQAQSPNDNMWRPW